MYLVQTVSSSPKFWSSWNNINKEKDESTLKSMNSVEEISTYKSHFIEPYFSEFSKTSATTYDFPERPPKKEKKWSFGSFFRRKKKEESESSNDDEVQKKNTKKNKSHEKRKRVSKPLTFDHIVVPPQNKNSVYNTSTKEDIGVLSDPFPDGRIRTDRPLPRVPIAFNDQSQRKESVSRNDSVHSQNSHDSADSYKRGRRGRSKARAAARRDTKTKNGSSSDEDSQQSYSSVRFRSDESITRQRDNSASRRSRTARTERYNRRLSKDDESILNREAMLRQAKENWHLKVSCDSTAYGIPPNGSPITRRSQKNVQPFNNNEQKFSGLFTIPPSHNSSSYRNPIYSNTTQYAQLPKVAPQENQNRRHCFDIRSLSCEGNIHDSPSPEPACDIIRANLPIKAHSRQRNMSLVIQPNHNQSPPPMPPPRDPRRLYLGQPDPYKATKPVDNIQHPHIHPNDQRTFLSQTSQWHRGFRTTSEDNIQTEPKMILTPRPSSVTHETRERYYRNHCIKESPEQFHYLTEKKPRSRRPIFIQSTDKINTTNHFNRKQNATGINSVSNYEDFCNKNKRQTQPTTGSPQIFTSQTHVQTKIFLPSVVENEKKYVKEKSPVSVTRGTSPFRPISSPTMKKESASTPPPQSTNLTKVQSNSKNLEEALDELEEIYKSLHLGDEDLLERAEQREMSIAAKRRIELTSEHYPNTTYIPRGAISDSGFSYECSKDPSQKINKSQTLERRSDDMAYRKLNKDLSNAKVHQQNVLANVSYLLASPIHAPTDEPDNASETVHNNEPDITLDDVVYRTIKHANNSLKVMEPQPPFGIPVGPVAPAANSDYLHAIPEKSITFTYTKKKEPDVVKDDLAFRNLRKDNKDNSLKPLLSNEDNNININKKRRAVRSLSANISNIMHKDNCYYRKHYDYGCDNEFKQTSLTDIADAMDIARQILKDKENKIYKTRKAFLSDDETRSDAPKLVNSDTINENRLNFLNEMRSKCLDRNSKDYRKKSLNDESFAVTDNSNITETESPKKETSDFEDLLTALAVEARETSDRITNDLKNLEVDLDKKYSKDLKFNEEVLIKDSEDSNKNEHTNLCKKLLECVVESTELIATPRTESTPVEEVENIEISIPQTMANIITTRILEDEIDEKVEPAVSEIYSTSEPDYDNMGSDLDFETSSKSPFEEQRESIIASFADINKLEEQSNESACRDNKEDDNVPVENCGGEDCAFDVNALFSNPECGFVTEYEFNKNECGVLTHMTNCNLFVSDASENCKLDEYEPSSGFHSNSSCTDSFVEEHLPIDTNFELDDTIDKIPSLLVESLKSPKLVNTAMKNSAPEIEKVTNSSKTERNSLENFQENRASSSRENQSNKRDTKHKLPKTKSWYGDPLVIAFACSYGVACSYQVASLDIVAILAMFFVILSIAVAIFYE